MQKHEPYKQRKILKEFGQENVDLSFNYVIANYTSYYTKNMTQVLNHSQPQFYQCPDFFTVLKKSREFFPNAINLYLWHAGKILMTFISDPAYLI